MLYWFGKIFIAPFVWLIYRPKVLHWKRLRSKGGVMYLCNHFSLADAVAITAVNPRTVHFMGKESLFSTPIGNLFFRSLLMIPAGEEGSHLGPVKRAIAMLQKGMAFGIFPEGHRSVDYTDQDTPEKGAAFIAVRTNAPIIPIYVDPLCWKRMRIRMSIGEWIYPDQVAKNCPGQRPVDAVLDAIEDALMTLRQEVEDTVPPRLKKKV